MGEGEGVKERERWKRMGDGDGDLLLTLTEGSSMQLVNVTQVCAGHAWSVECCACVAKRESSGNSNLLYYNASTNTYFAGLFQISIGLWKTCNSASLPVLSHTSTLPLLLHAILTSLTFQIDSTAPCDLSSNLRCANSMFKSGGNTWKAWKSSCGPCNCCGSP